MTSTGDLAEQINHLCAGGGEAAPVGTLRVFGDWFGRPHDNWHRPVLAESSGEVLRVRFDSDEWLTVWSPADCLFDSAQFRIRRADRVRWDWESYGPTSGSGPRYVEEHWIEDGAVLAMTTAPWAPNFNPSMAWPAVELLGPRAPH